MPIREQAGVMTPGTPPEDRESPTDDTPMTTPVPTTATPVVRSRARRDEPYAVVGPSRNEGHGKRLTAAFEALEVFPALAELPAPWTAEAVEGALRTAVERSGRKPKQVYQPLRVAIAGSSVSPGIFESVALLGRDETLARVDHALDGRQAA